MREYDRDDHVIKWDDEDICDCIIVKIKDDMASRFSNEELDELFEQRLKGAYALRARPQPSAFAASSIC